MRDGDRARKCRGAARIEPRLGDRGGARGSRRPVATTHGLRPGEADVKEKDEPLGLLRARRAGLVARGALAAFERAVGRRCRVRPGVRRGGRAGPRDVPRRFAASIVFEFIRRRRRRRDDDVEKREKAFGSRDESAADAKGVEGRLAPVCFLAQTCGRWGGCGYDAALCESLRCAGLRATPVGGETPRDASVGRRVFSVEPADDGGARAERRVRGGGRGASPPASRAASARRRRGCRGGGHVRGRQSRRGGAARHERLEAFP